MPDPISSTSSAPTDYDPSVDAASSQPACDPEASGGCEPTPTDTTYDATNDPPSLATSAANLWASATDSLSLDKQLGKQIDQLKPGESMKLGYGASVGAGVEVSGKKEIEIAKTDAGKYEISTGGQIGIGAKVESGGKTSVFGQDAEAKIETSIGLKKTMEFDSAEEAKSAANYLVGGALLHAGTSTMMPGLSGVADSGWDLTHSDAKSGTDANLKSIQLSGSIGGDVEAMLGAKGKEAFAGLNAKAEGEVGTSASVELKDGSPSAIVVESRVKLATAGAVGFKVGENSASLGGAFEGQAEAVVQQKFAIPSGLTLAQIEGDPAGAMKKIAKAADPEVTASVSFKGKNGSQGVEGKLSVPGDITAFNTPEIRNALSQGDFRGAAAGLTHVPGFSADAWLTKEHGSSGAFDLGAGGYSIGGEFTATRTERTQKLFSFGAAAASE